MTKFFINYFIMTWLCLQIFTLFSCNQTNINKPIENKPIDSITKNETPKTKDNPVTTIYLNKMDDLQAFTKFFKEIPFEKRKFLSDFNEIQLSEKEPIDEKYNKLIYNILKVDSFSSEFNDIIKYSYLQYNPLFTLNIDSNRRAFAINYDYTNSWDLIIYDKSTESFTQKLTMFENYACGTSLQTSNVEIIDVNQDSLLDFKVYHKSGQNNFNEKTKKFDLTHSNDTSIYQNTGKTFKVN